MNKNGFLTKIGSAILILFNSYLLSGQIRNNYNPANIDLSRIEDVNNLLHDYCTSIKINDSVRIDLFSPKMFRVRQSALKGERFPFYYQIPFAMGKYDKWDKVAYQKTEDEIFIYITTSALQIRFLKINTEWMVWDNSGKNIIYPSEGIIYGMIKNGYCLFDAASYFFEKNDNSRYSHYFYNVQTKRYDIFLQDDLMMDKYFIYGPDYRGIFNQHNSLVGPEPLLSKKAYGSFQTQSIGCAEGTQDKLMEVINRYNRFKIPLDNIIIDLEWGDGCDGKKDITWGSKLDWSESFSKPLTPQKFLDTLKSMDINVMLIHHNVPDYPGRIKQGWTSIIYPWEQWWNAIYKDIDMGVSGTWQDTRNNDITDHYIYLGLQDYTNKRPYFLGNYDNYENCSWTIDKMYIPKRNLIGMRRSPFHWTGDEDFTWAEYLFKIDALTNTYGSMRGISYLGTDCVANNWMLQARRNPFNEFTSISRTHSIYPWRDHKIDLDLFAFNTERIKNADNDINQNKESESEIKQLIDIIRKYRSLRYQLILYIYSAAYENYLTGMPICRPLILAFQEDPRCNKNQFPYQYMFGPDLLIAPVYSNSGKKAIYLPKLPKDYTWIDYWDKKDYKGDSTIQYDITDIAKMPVFVKSGAIIPMQSKRLRITPEPEDTVFFDIFPAIRSSCILYDDDGSSLEYQKGKYGKTEITFNKNNNNESEIHISSLKGEFKNKPVERSYILNLNLQNYEPKQVLVNDEKIRKSLIADNKYDSFWNYNKEEKLLMITKKEYTSKSLNIKVLY
jgi:alpha-glucosidase